MKNTLLMQPPNTVHYFMLWLVSEMKSNMSSAGAVTVVDCSKSVLTVFPGSEVILKFYSQWYAHHAIERYVTIVLPEGGRIDVF